MLENSIESDFIISLGNLKRVGRYELLKKLGRGGAGVDLRPLAACDDLREALGPGNVSDGPRYLRRGSGTVATVANAMKKMMQ